MAPISMSKDRPSPQESFTQMADKDLESIGRHCQFEYCNQLDFLPFRCESCRGTFCLDHRTETSHKCPKAGEWARRRNAQNASPDTSLPTQKPTIYNSDQCAHLDCKTLINTMKDPGVRCPNCNRQYCLKHRLREEHDCAKITPLGGRPAAAGANANETLRSMFARVRTWGKEKSHAATQSLTPTPKPNSPAARAVQLNTLKKSAKGDANVPADKRLYLHVVGTSDTQRVDPPNGDFYFDSRWKVGRVLDDAARRLRVENVNNRADEKERLRIFHVESGEFLEFSDAIGAGKVQSGHTIVLMRGAGVMLGK
ncbi:hypothetical protein F9C07_2146959 [Aspergillus flavus]|uniref:AN1-type domain-containing protein n=8 Tax=Aspergillus subgen. Circumdati TaxID=2720871 RepID=A0A7U2R106_ASPFN|nr:unnamed protein product [Aspergillus oryzae RIB40]XP_041150662.1 uncharacterized protein G4B84_011150 [Aspergillus flavus NRRL3357]EIT77792.1 putative Zn-finger protein [Aspergillus oryzae 3.042]KAB8245881.1 hypothetical protein BDV35DRAFT_240369 [Aspergillus flavus]KAE8308513.1 hypothetical protein BDV41DRAFT_502788 [Aspergillus transmontanensis]KAE8338900.1 hypothetical protein BDV24DRAFT_137120 [Aspergillus arachidicola]KDE75706.1 putative Zn-finger protein [Aspergillus oryzae 100-8]KJ|eukprot:EIT77792.1 putative Zn-finger protein [Aspergillus oryzae 3.042]